MRSSLLLSRLPCFASVPRHVSRKESRRIRMFCFDLTPSPSALPSSCDSKSLTNISHPIAQLPHSRSRLSSLLTAKRPTRRTHTRQAGQEPNPWLMYSINMNPPRSPGSRPFVGPCMSVSIAFSFILMHILPGAPRHGCLRKAG